MRRGGSRSHAGAVRTPLPFTDVESHVVSPYLATLVPQALHRPANSNRFPWAERRDRIFRNEGAAGSNPVSSTISPPGYTVEALRSMSSHRSPRTSPRRMPDMAVSCHKGKRRSSEVALKSPKLLLIPGEHGSGMSLTVSHGD